MIRLVAMKRMSGLVAVLGVVVATGYGVTLIAQSGNAAQRTKLESSHRDPGLCLRQRLCVVLQRREVETVHDIAGDCGWGGAGAARVDHRITAGWAA